MLEPSLRSNRASANTRAKALVGEIVQAHFPLPLHLLAITNLLLGKVRNERSEDQGESNEQELARSSFGGGLFIYYYFFLFLFFSL